MGNLRPLLVLGFTCCALVAVIVTVMGSQRDAVAPTAHSNLTLSPTTTVASVNGLDIPVREVLSFIVQDRAATFAYFQQRYGASDHAGFWSTPYGGQTPQEYIKKAALTDITRITVQQQLAHQYGLLADPSYGAFVQAWMQENTRRQQALAQHQIIYGPVQYTETNYFSYLFNQMVFDLEPLLVQHGIIDTSDKVLYPYYLAHEAAFQQAPTAATSHSQPYEHVTLVTPPFTQVRGEVEQKYVDEQYAALVSNITNQAHVVIDQAVYDAITVN